MKLLGIDYGRKKTGLAMGETENKIAEPLKVLRLSEEEVFKKVEEEARKEQVELIVVGVSEGKMEIETRKFGRKLQQRLRIPVVFQDETLTTHEAHELSIRAGIRRKKRREMEDAYSAALILREYFNKLTIELPK